MLRIARACTVLRNGLLSEQRSGCLRCRDFSARTAIADVVICGGGVIGNSAAYHLALNRGSGVGITVIERDPTYAKCSTALSASSIRHQFSTPANIQMSLFGTHFLRNVAELLRVEGEDEVHLGFKEAGYTFLATAAGLSTLQENHTLQTELGADIALHTPEELKEKFPWLNVEGIVAGTHGLSGEGWFDAYGLMMGLKRKAVSMGVTYVQGEVTGILTEDTGPDGRRIKGVDVTCTDGTHRVSCNHLLNAAGPRASLVSSFAGIQLPVSPRKRCVFVFDCREPVLNAPLLVDTTGVYFRPEHDLFICGVTPEHDPEVGLDDFEVDHDLFCDVIWPALAHRVPAFECIKVVNYWAGHYSVNEFDHNVIVGPCPGLKGFHFANGFSGHGLQQAPAIGRACAELIDEGRFVSIDLSAFGYERLAANRPVIEKNVV